MSFLLFTNDLPLKMNNGYSDFLAGDTTSHI